MSRNYVIIDTDCGIDDSLAIVLAAHCQQQSLIEILAITCSHGNTCVDNVTKNVCHTLRACDLLGKVKVYAGCGQPIIGKRVNPAHYGDDGLGGATKDLPPIEVQIEGELASNALIELAKKYPKQITLLALGPLTNIAVAYMLDNRFFDNLQQIVYMGGTVNNIGNMEPTTEFNVFADPEACHVMLTNAKCPLTFVPWECGLSNLLTWDIYEQISNFTSTKAKFMQKVLAKDYERVKSRGTKRKGLILCDILAVAAFAFPSLVRTHNEYRTTVELSGRLTRGQLICDKRSGFSYKELDAPKVKFVQHFDQTELMNLFLQLFQ